MAAKKSIHILRYGTVAEKIHLEKAITAYDYLSINGNTAAYVSNAIAKFVVAKFFSRKDKGFFIDPITYAFQNEIRLLKTASKSTGTESIKKSVNKLIDYYGFPAEKVRAGSTLTVEDFQDSNIKEQFCERVIAFQYNLIYDHITENDLQKYLDYVAPQQSKNIAQLRPKFLIAPYFYLDVKDSRWEDWLSLNIDFVKIAKRLATTNCNNTPVFAQIVISKDLLINPSAISMIVSLYNNLDCDGFTIWVDDLCEHSAKQIELASYLHLLSGLHNKPIYNMYGGFFSILLTNKEIGLLDGVSHGLEYGESRKVYPVGGGIPVSKYYFFPLHQRLDFTKAFYLLEHEKIIDTTLINWGSSEKYYNEICKCAQCKKILKKDMLNFLEFESREYYEIHRNEQVLRRKKASADTKTNCLYHYLLCKKMEFYFAENSSLSTLIQQMESSFNRFKNCDAMRKGELDYLDKWCQLLQSVEWSKNNE